MKSPRLVFAAIAAACVTSVAAFAADTAVNSDPSGSWKWTIAFNDQTFDSGAKFDFKDGKLSGTLTTPMGETPFTDGSFKDGMVAFTLTFDGDAGKVAVKYHGKLDGDTITGSIDLPGFNGGDPRTVDWKATRVKADAKPDDAAKPN